ncbi:MAG: hypothetical protein WC374_10830 [Phycisphaerae bacterium]
MMARKAKKGSKAGQKLKEFVAVAFARDEIEAKEYETLLAGEDIPVTIRQQGDADDGYSVMVPEEYVDEAYVIIESQDAFEDYYDDADEGGIDLGSEEFDDEY